MWKSIVQLCLWGALSFSAVLGQTQTEKIEAQLAIADSLIAFGEQKEGVSIAREIAEIAIREGRYEYLSHSLNLQGRSFTLLQKFPNAIQLLDSSIRIGETHLQQPNLHTAQAYNNLGYCQQIIGQGNESIENVRKALKMRKALFGMNEGPVIQSYFILSVVLGREGNYEEEKRYLDTVVQATETIYGADSYQLFQPLNNLGVWHSAQGDRITAQHYYEKALELAEGHFPPDDIRLSPAFNNLGNLLLRRGAYPEALVYLHRALELNQEKRQASAARNWLNIGNAQMALKNYPEANISYGKSLAMEAEIFGKDYPNRALTLTFQSKALLKLDNREEARANLIQAEKILRKAPPRFDQSRARLTIAQGEWEYQFTDRDTARKTIEKGIALLVKILSPSHPKVLNAQLDLAKLELESENPEQVHSIVARIRENLFPKASSAQANESPAYKGNRYTWPIQQKANLLEAKAYFQDKFHPESEKAFREIMEAISLTDSIRTHLLDTKSQLAIAEEAMSMYELAIDISAKLYSETKEKSYLASIFSIMEKSKSFVLSRNLTTPSGTIGGSIPDSLAARERHLKSGLARYDRLLHDQDKGTRKGQIWDSTRFALGQSYDSFCQNLKRDFPAYYQLKFHPGNIELPELMEKLPEGEVLVEYFSGETNWYVLGITQQTTRFWQIRKTETIKPHPRFAPDEAKGDAVSLETHLNNLLKAISSPPDLEQPAREIRNTFTLSGTAVYQNLLRPVLGTILPKSLVVVPDGKLRHLPFEILLTERDVHNGSGYTDLPYLFRTTQIHYLNAARYYIENPSEEVEKEELLAFAPSKFPNEEGNSLSSLPYTEAEVKRAVEIMGGESRLGPLATEEQFKQNASAYQVIHLATHARMDDSLPQHSGFYLSSQDSSEDGFLHGWELVGLRLKAELAVLSACNTGTGKNLKGEGVLSLARDFRLAGCPSVLMSLWNANDQTTSTLMESFYQEIANGKGKSDALQQAKLAYLEGADPLRSHPHYWAGFVLVGDDQPIREEKSMVWAYALILGTLGTLIGLLVEGIKKRRRKKASLVA